MNADRKQKSQEKFTVLRFNTKIEENVFYIKIDIL